jgi:hypothetical protein
MLSWVEELWLHDYTHQLSLQLDIGDNEWSNFFCMNGENEMHKRHGKTLIEKKISHLP